jgi:uncharacterized protein
MQALLGEGAVIVIEGQRVLPEKTQKDGYQFQFATVEEALQDLFA